MSLQKLIASILEEEYKLTQKIIENNKDTIIALAPELVKRKVMDSNDIEEFFKNN